jgi:asparagine synthase (glutamine-hydrolysing)
MWTLHAAFAITIFVPSDRLFMCAIGGWLVEPRASPNKTALDRMMAAMTHRGPDDAGRLVDGNVGLAIGHNRLSIIDLSTGGHQPMVNPKNGDILSFNGEIYNFRELRRELEVEGHRFQSRSDTEVLLHSFAAWGAECVLHIRGMFAFAVWRPTERALYLFRDPMGVKPLYYWTPPGGGIVFSSELKALLEFPGFRPSLDRRAVGQFLEFGFTFEDGRTILSGVQKLPPGHYIRVRANQKPELERYFCPKVASGPVAKLSDVEKELYAALKEVTAQHLIADVPVGLLLSGGLDSSLIAALAARQTKVRTFTMGFSHSDLDERAQARCVARHIGSEHDEIVITPREVTDDLENTIACFDDLFADWGTISTRLLYGKCRERGIKVVLVGEGADELFGGYNIFRSSDSRAPTDWWLFQLYRHYCGRRYGRYFGAFRALMRDYLTFVDGNRFDGIRLFETRNQLPNNYVMKVDKASMSVSVEARVPYLDQRVAEVAYRIPKDLLLTEETEKNVLRRVARHFQLLPEETLTRPKLGGSIAASWLDDQPVFRSFAQGIILAKGGWTEALGLRPAMAAYFVKNRTGYAFPRSVSIFRNLAWRLLILEMWSNVYRIAPDVG